MRWKLEGDDPNAYRCCLCCHVRTGTIFLGLFHLMVHILVLSLFALVVLHPELAPEQSTLTITTENAGFDNNFSYGNVQWFKDQNWTSEDKFIGLLITMGSFFVTVLLVYGAAKGQAGYMMPFFCLQVFDFCVSCLTIVGYFSYMPDIKKWINEQPSLPLKENLLQMDGDWLMLLAIIFFVLILTIKAYFIGVVWSCYKYLNQRPVSSIMRPYDAVGGEDAEMLLPPKYEDALRMAAEQPPPPPYYAA